VVEIRPSEQKDGQAMKYDRTMTITAYTVPEGGILMINIAEGEWDICDVIEPTIAVIDLDANDRVLGIEVLNQEQFDLDSVAAEYGIAELVPEIRAAIAVAKPGP
jgi:hypothetical protein